MNRRTVLQLLALGGAGTAGLPVWVERLTEVGVAHGPASGDVSWKPAIFTPRQDQTVAAIAELIIPQTDTAGAKAARVNEFIDTVIADADAPERDSFLEGLEWIDRRSRELHGADFVSVTPDRQVAMLSALDGASSAASDASLATGVHFFRSIKALTITGYYTSKIGMKDELGDDGRTGFPDYTGCTHPEHKAGV